MNVTLSKANSGEMLLSSNNYTFVNTCPFTINQLPVAPDINIIEFGLIK